MVLDSFRKNLRAAHVAQVVHLPLDGVQILAQGLKLIPHIGLGGLHLAQLRIVLLHLLLQGQAVAAAAAAAQAAAQGQGQADQGNNRQRTDGAHTLLVMKVGLCPAHVCGRCICR